MRILLVTGHFFMAEGAIAKGIAKALKNHDVFFFSVHDFKYRFGEFINLTKEVDVVHWLFNVGHLHEKYNSVFKDLSLPNIATVHHVDSDELYKINQASFANSVHVVSHEWLLFLKKHTQTPLILAPLGVFIDKFETLKTNLYEGTGTFKIGIMGFYPGRNNRKRLDIAITVLKELVAKNIDIELIVQGSGWENYFSKFDEIGLKYNHYKFASDKNNLEFFENIHVYMCTSDIEGGPLPVLEAMASGVPVISTEVGMAIDLLNQEGGGLLCEKGNIKSLVEAVVLLKDDNKLYKKLAKNTKVIAQKYDWINLEYQYNALYENTIKIWEECNLLPWEYRSSISLKAIEQRRRELIHSDIHQVRSLLQNNNKKDALILLVTLLFNNKIASYRKIKLVKESIHLISKNK